jgi:hypothetical protein
MRSPRPSTGHAVPVKDYPIEQTVSSMCVRTECSGMINTRWNAGAFKPVKRLTYGLIRVSNKNQLPLCSGGLCLPPWFCSAESECVAGLATVLFLLCPFAFGKNLYSNWVLYNSVVPCFLPVM